MLPIHEAKLGPTHPFVGKTLHLLAQLGEKHRDVAMSALLAAQAHLIAGKYAEALPLVDLMQNAHPDFGIALQPLGSAQTRANKDSDALVTHQRIVALLQKTLGPDHLQTAQAQLNLAMSLRTAKRCTDARPTCSRCSRPSCASAKQRLL